MAREDVRPGLSMPTRLTIPVDGEVRFRYLREVVADTADERGLVHAFVNFVVNLVDVREIGPELDPKLVATVFAAVESVRHRIEPADTRAFARMRVKQRAHLEHCRVDTGGVQARSIDDVARDNRKVRAAALHAHRVAAAAAEFGYAGNARVCRHDRAVLFDVAGEREHQLVLIDDTGRRAAEDVPAAADIVKHRVVADARRRVGRSGDKLARREDAGVDVELARFCVHGEEVRFVLLLTALRDVGICGAVGRYWRGDDVLADTLVPHVLGLAVGVHELVAFDAELSLQRVWWVVNTCVDDAAIS
ncbi:hypothetical protein AYI70_g1558 [Smittium culicis]|uniref:Uncharacterized protein n=1 Tax=Smittium culicis TaxID=133412 RepID=A0A1R1YC54_9FUNG|nr:hypothetical protein AYI70_g1558 [Smittium culicis]